MRDEGKGLNLFHHDPHGNWPVARDAWNHDSLLPPGWPGTMAEMAARAHPQQHLHGVSVIRPIASGVLFCLVSLQGHAPSSLPTIRPAPGADKVQIIEAIRTMYRALTRDDLVLFHTVAAADFYAFDVGKRFTGDALMELIKSLHAAGKLYAWSVTEPEVHLEGDTAWITYTNRGSVQSASGTQSLAWLESAVLRKEKAGWRIHFLHSTRVP